MTLAEALGTTRSHRVAGRTGDRTASVTTRPCRAPHYTPSDVGLIGGGQVPMPGEGSLAQNGVLSLDERPECRRHDLEVLRQPLKDGVIYRQSRGRLRLRCYCDLSRTAHDLKGSGQRIGAAQSSCGRPAAWGVTRSPPLQRLSLPHAFRLTPSPTWSTDTASQTPMSMARVEVSAGALPDHRPVLGRAQRGLPCAACTVSIRTVRLPAFAPLAGAP
jgi:hypothetical protein